jgi:prefoldin subunit 5
MSDLKHRSIEDLRAIVFSCSKRRAELEISWQDMERQIEDLKKEIAEKRHSYHNLGQREAWARIYLARKTTF